MREGYVTLKATSLLMQILPRTVSVPITRRWRCPAGEKAIDEVPRPAPSCDRPRLRPGPDQPSAAEMRSGRSSYYLTAAASPPPRLPCALRRCLAVTDACAALCCAGRLEKRPRKEC